MATFEVPTRDELKAKYKRDIKYRATSIDFGQDDRVEIDASANVDLVLPIFAEAQRFADTTPLSGRTFEQLQDEAVSKGLAALIPATGSSGFVIADTGATGAAVTKGDIIIDPNDNSVSWQAIETKVYFNGQVVPIVALSTGPGTDRDPGTVLQWRSPPAGMGLNAIVFEASDGTGLTGGRDVETRDQLIERIESANANPAAAGNDAAYIAAMQQTPSLGVEAAFVVSASTGPGACAAFFTVRPAKRGASRVPNNAQIGLVRAWVVGNFDKSDSSAFCPLISIATTVILKVKWSHGIASWADAVQWPPYSAVDTYKIKNTTTPTATSFTIGTTDPGPIAPQVGQTIALFNRAKLQFVAKKILTVTVVNASTWTVTIDTTNAASDATFIPSIGDIVMPWSKSLNLLVDPTAAYFETLGPSEMTAAFFDEGFRQRRQPASPAAWPNEVRSVMTDNIEKMPAVDNVIVVAPALPYATPVGVMGVSANLLELGQFAVYPG